MKLILAAMCALVVLFMGGCAILALAAGPLALLPAGIAVLNLLIIGALYGWKFKWRPAFYILGVADLLIAVVILLLAYSSSSGMTAADAQLVWIPAAVIFVKGVLTLLYAQRGAGLQ